VSKKIPFSIPAILIFLICSACIPNSISLDYVLNDNANNIIIIENEPNFRIFQNKDMLPWYLHYEVYNNKGDIVESFITSRTAWIRNLNENILEIGVSVGTGTTQVRFYSIEHDIFSDFFLSPFLVKSNIIAEMRLVHENKWALIFQDIFVPTTFLKEFYLTNLPSTISPFFSIVNIEYIGDGSVSVTHLSGDHYDEITTVLHLFP